MSEVFIGVDVSKDRLDVHVLPEGAAFAVARTPAGLSELIEQIKPRAPYLIALEATGGLESVVVAALAGAGPARRCAQSASDPRFRARHRQTC